MAVNFMYKSINRLLCLTGFSCYFFSMWLFCVFLLPVYYILRNLINNSSTAVGLKGSVFMYIAGIVLGALYSTASMLIFSVNPYLEYNFGILFIRKLLFLTIPPVAILLLLLLLISKDTLVYKVQLYPDLLTGFYSVYLPFTVLGYHKVLSFYPLFIEPLVFLLMIVSIRSALNGIIAASASYAHPLRYVCFSLIIIISLCLPALMQVVWIMGLRTFFLVLLFSVSIALCAGTLVLCKKKP